MPNALITRRFVALLGLPALLITGRALAADAVVAKTSDSAKPAWVSDAALGAKLAYDDNVLGVSGLGMPEKSSWVSTFSLKLGINLVPVLNTKAIQAFSLTYAPDVVRYDSLSQENYTAHRFNQLIKAKSGSFTFSLDNAFLFVDGNKVAPTYALNQLAGALANQNDKSRNNYAHGLARERRNQYQDRYTVQLQYDSGNYFVRPMSNLTYYDLNTDLHNTGVAPYKGYQDYVDRYDINGGVDLGYKVTKGLALVVGYRDGYQYQQRFAPAINADQHASDSHYQRLLVGAEGKLSDSLKLKVAVGPDFRDYSASTPITSPHTTRWYGEASLTATIAPNETFTVNFKQWIFVASTGLAPYQDTTLTAVYHYSPVKDLGIDLGAKYLEANYLMGNAITGSAPSLRDDIDYGLTFGVTYNLSPHLVLSANFAYDVGRNNVDNLPAALFANYREFEHEVTTVGVQYSF